MTLRPWRDVIAPHQDVLDGTFEEAKFAADLTAVVKGLAAPEYQDARLFFERTYITEGMRLLLQSVIRRMAGKGGDPVVQLQTAFGGGKTHTMMAVLHAVNKEAPAGPLAGLVEVNDLVIRAGLEELPRARVAVLDGNALGPSQPRTHGGVTVSTLWGEMAWQLGKKAGHDSVAAADRDGTSPGKEILAALFERSAPCVVLLDEAVAYIRQLEPGQRYAGGTYNANLSFLQALTEAAALVPRAMVLATLPESMMEAGDPRAQDTLATLEKYFGRIEAVWKPVATDEAFEIVRRRLFGAISDDSARDAVCRAFADMYLADKDRFPAETCESQYERRLRASYPIHPEVFERLYEDWSTLPRFQRTRGVLRLMAHIIHRLWRADNRDLLVLPGSIPLDDPGVRNELIKYLPHGWDPIVDRDIDGHHAEPRQIDDSTAALGSLQACRRVARTIFLGSAPSVAEQKVRGIGIERVRLGCAQPGQAVGRYDDGVRRLSDRLHYLYSGKDRYWFDSRPNLRREMEERMQRFDTRLHVDAAIKEQLEKAIQAGQVGMPGKVHVFRPSEDVPDRPESRLVVLDPDHGHKRRERDSAAIAAARVVLDRHGERTREWKNLLLFLAADRDAVPRLREETRRFLSWQSIVDDVKLLNLDDHHEKEAKKGRDDAAGRLKTSLAETYRWLLVPRAEATDRGLEGAVSWEEAALDLHGAPFARAIAEEARGREWSIGKWAPTHLRDVLLRWYWKDDRRAVSAIEVWQDLGKYLYLPRLASLEVFLETLEEGVKHRDYFGYAAGTKGDGGYEGLLFGKAGRVYLDEHALLVEPDAARAALALVEADDQLPPGRTGGEDGRGPGEGLEAEQSGVVSRPAAKRRFHATVDLSPITAGIELGDIIDNVIEPFTAQYGTRVSITVDIEATRPEGDGFDATLQRTITENCRTLKFRRAAFEED